MEEAPDKARVSAMPASLPADPPDEPGALRPARRRRPPESVVRLGIKGTPGLLRALPKPARRLLSGIRSVVIDGNTLDPTVQLFLALQRASGVTGLAVGRSPAATRARMRASCLAFGGESAAVAVTDLTIPGPAGPIPVRHYHPNGPGPSPLLVFFHGGGYVFGDLDSHDAFCRQTCRDADVHVLSVDYRLAPEHPAPAAVNDAYTAFTWAMAHGAELGAAPGRVAVGGDSAGGALSAVVCQLARDAGAAPPELQFLIYPVTDVDAQTRSRTLFASGFLLTKANMEWFTAQYLEGSGLARSDPRVSPLRATDLSGLPPALVVTAGFDPLRDEGEAYAEALRAAGVAVDLRRMTSMPHTFINLGGFGGGPRQAIAELISALRAHLSRAPSAA